MFDHSIDSSSFKDYLPSFKKNDKRYKLAKPKDQNLFALNISKEQQDKIYL